MIDSKERFSSRVDAYVRHRPSYPPTLLDLLARSCGLAPNTAVADVGSGTGILTALLLDRGARVAAVEPNAAMRAAAERALGGREGFRSVDGSAEATGLGPRSIGLITAAQAFHWFDPARARAEFVRILRPGGFVALIWNQRADTPFNREYEDMLERFAPDYAEVRERDRAAEPLLRAFFAPSSPRFARFDNEQRFDLEGLRGRLASSSYAPRVGHPLHEPLSRRLGEMFAVHARDGFVSLGYDTIVWYAQIE
jgi:SAM-dependent methyltransferase